MTNATLKNLFLEYEKAETKTLYDVYTKPSVAKERAWERVLRLAKTFDGIEIKVVHFNTFSFTAGFMFPDAETGALQFAYITKDNIYVWDITL